MSAIGTVFKGNANIVSFNEFKCFTSVTWIGHNTQYGAAAFAACSNLQEITMPHGLVGIGCQCFNRCTKLTKAVISNTVTTISGQAFQEASGYKNVVIPDSVRSIGGACFGYPLSKVTIGTGIKTIYNSAFGKWNHRIPVFIIKSITPPPLTSSGFFYTDNQYYPNNIYVPDNCVDAYKTAWSPYQDVIKPMSSYTGEIPPTDY